MQYDNNKENLEDKIEKAMSQDKQGELDRRNKLPRECPVCGKDFLERQKRKIKNLGNKINSLIFELTKQIEELK